MLICANVVGWLLLCVQTGLWQDYVAQNVRVLHSERRSSETPGMAGPVACIESLYH